MNNLVLAGVSHKTAPVAIRERVAFPPERIPAALQLLQQDEGLQESMIVSTCNRVEILAGGEDSGQAFQLLNLFFSSFHSLPASSLSPYLYNLKHKEAIHHLFRVACSLDSMVVGEPQILSQIKDAYRLAAGSGSIGPRLKALVPRAFFVAKRVRTETGIATSAVSISSVAVELARKIFGELQGKTILILGAGKMGELAARKLVESGVSRVLVSNRTPQRGETLARRFSASTVPWEQLDEGLFEADIILVSTASRSYVLERKGLAGAIRKRKNRPLFVIDIAVPRNVDPEANKIGNVFLYDVDDLQAVIHSNLDGRLREAELAEKIVSEEVSHFLRRHSLSRNGPLIAALRQRVEEICLEELGRDHCHWSSEQRQEMRRILIRTAHRLAHPMIMKIKQPDTDPKRRMQELELLRELFRLREKP